MSSWTRQIEQELNWRENELTSLKILAATKTMAISSARKALLRSLTVMLYAHYEGFCKFIWELYLDEIRRSQVKRKNCCEELIIFSLKKNFREMSGSFTTQQMWEMFSTHLPQLLEEEIRFDCSPETNSNLWPALLKSNLKEIHLSCSVLDTHETTLRALLNRRNDIAHGQQNIINTLSDYETYENAVFEVMYDLGITVIDSLDNSQYLSTPSP